MEDFLLKDKNVGGGGLDSTPSPVLIGLKPGYITGHNREDTSLQVKSSLLITILFMAS